MQSRLILLASVVALGPTAGVAQAQTSQSAQFGYRAILLTPVGALPQIVQVQRPTKAAVALRFGRYGFKDGPTNNIIGGSANVRLASRLHAGGTFGYQTCTGCEGLTMGSLDLVASLFHKQASNSNSGGNTDIQLQASYGMGKANTSDVSARSYTVSAPLAVSLPQQNDGLLTLFFAPAVGYGSLDESGVSDGSMRMLIAAGVGYNFAPGLGAHATVHRIVIEDSPTQLGFALSWRFGGGSSNR